MLWEILHKLAELHSTEDILLMPKDGKLSTGHTHEDGQLQSDDICKLDAYTSRGIGVSGGIKGMAGGALGAGRQCMPSGASRVSGQEQAFGPPRDVGGMEGVGGCQGALEPVRGCRVTGVCWGTDRECRCSGARRGIWGIRGIIGVRGHWAVYGDIGGCQGCRGVRGALGAGRECRCSGASRGMGASQGIGEAHRGVWATGGIEGSSGV